MLSWRHELLLILLATTCALVVRIWHLDHLAVEHFDEGVYASNLFFSEEANYRYPQQHFYAPPLLPSIIEWTMTFLGDAPWIPILPGILFGTATIPLLWWFLRDSLGQLPAILAGTLLALNDYHIFYSRTALTEPLLGFFWILALALGFHAMKPSAENTPSITPRSLLIAAVCGVACGLCWWTKYNGWLTVFILAITSLLNWLVHDRTWTEFKTMVIKGCLIIATTLLVFSPYLSSLQPQGGYAAIMSHHQQYITGFSSWIQQATIQLDNLRLLTSWQTIVGILLSAAIAAVMFTNAFKQLSNKQSPVTSGFSARRALLGFLFSTSACLGSSLCFDGILIPFSTLLSFYCLIVFQTYWDSDHTQSRRPQLQSASKCILLFVVWNLTLILLTTLYYPYPRLILPLVLAQQINYALTIFFLINYVFHMKLSSSPSPLAQYPSQLRQQFRRMSLVLIACPLITVSIIYSFYHRQHSPVLTSFINIPSINRTDLRTATLKVVEHIRSEHPDPSTPLVVYVYGEPAVFWHLSQQGILAGPVADLQFIEASKSTPHIPVYLLTRPHYHKSETFLPKPLSVFSVSYTPSLLVTMDRLTPHTEQTIDELTLIRIQ